MIKPHGPQADVAHPASRRSSITLNDQEAASTRILEPSEVRNVPRLGLRNCVCCFGSNIALQGSNKRGIILGIICQLHLAWHMLWIYMRLLFLNMKRPVVMRRPAAICECKRKNRDFADPCKGDISPTALFSLIRGLRPRFIPKGVDGTLEVEVGPSGPSPRCFEA